MATTGGQPSAALETALVEKSHEFDFFQAVRLCLRLRSKLAAPGQFALPSQEALRFRQINSFTFPPAVVDSIQELHKWRQDGSLAPFEIALTVLGLTGYAGLLPWFYTKLLIEEQAATQSRKPSQAFAAFLDIFNHRLISLQYCAWEKHRPYVSYERNPQDLLRPGSLPSYLSALLGLAQHSVRDRLRVPDSVLLGYVGIFGSIPRSLAALRHLLLRFEVPVEVLAFQGRWSRLRASESAILGKSDDSVRLGEGATLGREIWYNQASFRIRLGPLSVHDFKAFQPGRARFGELVDLVNYFTRGQYEEFEVELLLRKEEVPFCYLKKNTFGTAPRLGRLGWLGENCKTRQRTDRSVVLRSNDRRAAARATVDRALKRFRQTLLQERNLDLRWSDETAQVYSEQLLHLSGHVDIGNRRSKDMLALLIRERMMLVVDRLSPAPDGPEKLTLNTVIQ